MRRSALLLCALVAALCCVACKSDPETGIDPEIQIQIYREAALRWYSMDELDRAEDQVVKALDIEPDDEQMQLMLGWIRLRRGRVEDVLIAERVFQEITRTTEDYRAFLGLGGTNERLGLSYLEASEAAETDGKAEELEAKAHVHMRSSIDAYEQTLALSPGNARALSGLQRVYSQLERYEKSLEYSESARIVVESEREFHRNQLDVPDLTAAEEDRLRKVVEEDEKALIANHMHAIQMMLKLARTAEALERTDEVLAMNPDNGSAWAMRAQALAKLERYEEAVESVDEFLALSADLDFGHPDVQRAFELRRECELELRGKNPKWDPEDL